MELLVLKTGSPRHKVETILARLVYSWSGCRRLLACINRMAYTWELLGDLSLIPRNWHVSRKSWMLLSHLTAVVLILISDLHVKVHSLSQVNHQRSIPVAA